MPNKPITARDLAAALSKEHELTKKKGQEMLGDLVAMITKHLKKGERVKITGLGILQVRNRAARMGRNPMPPLCFLVQKIAHFIKKKRNSRVLLQDNVIVAW